MEKMKEIITNGSFGIFKHDIQTILTLAYILSVGIGMLFSYQKFIKFGINIFDYADVFYFLTAPFADLRILLFTVASMVIVYSFFKFDLAWKRKYPEMYSKLSMGLDDKKWYEVFRYISFSLLLIFYMHITSDLYGKISKKEIKKQDDIEIRFSDNKIKTGKKIGKVNDMILLLTENKVEAVPITSFIKEIKIREIDE